MKKSTLAQRIVIALAILKGRKSGRIGPKSICPQLTREDGSPAYHQSEWNLEISSLEASCDGTKRK